MLVGTMFLSDVINNNATAVLMAPIALTWPDGSAQSPDPFLMAVAIGASCAFLTPIGHQSNTLVLAPGGYRFGDYWRMGLPLEASSPSSRSRSCSGSGRCTGLIGLQSSWRDGA